VESFNQTRENAQIAFDAGCDGVFLIQHDFQTNYLFEIYGRLRNDFPEAWIGINALGVDPWDIFKEVPFDVSGIWVDNARISETDANQYIAKQILAARRESGWDGLYFGGVGFKYQPMVKNLENVTRAAAAFMDVVTTSGPATGATPELEKIKHMSQTLNGKPLAIASGITTTNIGTFTPYAKIFLVATGISGDDFYNFDPELVQSLVQTVR
jgi:hypothetical protein